MPRTNKAQPAQEDGTWGAYFNPFGEGTTGMWEQARSYVGAVPSSPTPAKSRSQTAPRRPTNDARFLNSDAVGDKASAIAIVLISGYTDPLSALQQWPRRL